MMASLFADPTLKPLNRSAELAACKIDPLSSSPKEPPLQKTTIKSVSRAGHSGCPQGSFTMVTRSRSSLDHLLLAF
jgi:hypothetical protein